MTRLEIRALEGDHLDAAASLLAARHRQHRVAEPLLAERYEDAEATREELEALWAQDDASGALAVRNGQEVGFLLGTRKDDQVWGANVWIEAAGYAVDEPEVVRDLYAYASRRWVDEGRTRHYALVPHLAGEVEAWFRLAFGAQHAHGIQEVEQRAWPPGTRLAEPRDLDALAELAPLISNHQALSPVFSGIGWDMDAAELRAMLVEDIANDEVGELVFESDGRVVASFEIVPVKNGPTHRGLAEPEGAAYLGWAASLPEVRGTGAGVALMEAAHAWAHDQGYPSMITDWRETNLLSSRFWPARGFRRCFLRLYRSIP